MSVVGIDESGQFEINDKKLKFIGGFYYSGDDEEKEKYRIKELFNSCCKSLGLRYPNDLHGIDTMHKRNGKEILNKINTELINYMKQSGKYSFVCIVKGDKPRKDYQSASNIISETNASNLYERMACELVNNIILDNVVFHKDNELNFNIATRSLPIEDKSKKEEYEQLGYHTSRKRKNLFYITDQHTFKSAITTRLIDMRLNTNVNINLSVESINYNEDNLGMEFLYLADLICWLIRDSLDHNSYCILHDNDIKCWYYDDIDGLYNNLMLSYHNKDYIRCLELIYDIKRSNSTYTNFYIRRYIDKIEKNMYKIFRTISVSSYIKLAEIYFTKEENYNYEKGGYIVEKIIQDIDYLGLENNDVIDEAKYEAYDMLMRVCNHRGNTKGAKEYYEKCKKLAGSVILERYINTVLRAQQIYGNEFNYSKPIDEIENLRQVIDNDKENRKLEAQLLGIDGEKTYKSTHRGKALSSAGQFYGFIQDKENAMKNFNEALDEFEFDNKQKYITLSYILHAAISSNDRKLYKAHEISYFGSDDLKKQLELITESNNKDYKLFVYTKALNYFYGVNAPDNIIKMLQEMDFEAKGFNLYNHPWELICKEIAEIFYKKEKMSFGDKWVDKAIHQVQIQDFTIRLINNCTRIISYLYKKEPREILKVMKDFIKELDNYIEPIDYFNEIRSDIIRISAAKQVNNEEIYSEARKLIDKFTYMYI